MYLASIPWQFLYTALLILITILWSDLIFDPDFLKVIHDLHHGLSHSESSPLTLYHKCNHHIEIFSFMHNIFVSSNIHQGPENHQYPYHIIEILH